MDLMLENTQENASRLKEDTDKRIKNTKEKTEHSLTMINKKLAILQKDLKE